MGTVYFQNDKTLREVKVVTFERKRQTGNKGGESLRERSKPRKQAINEGKR